MAEKRNPSRIQPPAATHQTSGTQSIKTPQRPCSNAPVAMHQRPKSETRSGQEHDNGLQHQRKQTLWPQHNKMARETSAELADISCCGQRRDFLGGLGNCNDERLRVRWQEACGDQGCVRATSASIPGLVACASQSFSMLSSRA